MAPFYHYLFAFALLSRLADIGTTWLVSPKLKLEANPLARRLRWPFAFLTLLMAFFAYLAPPVCVALTVASFLVAGSNAMRIAQARLLGEEAIYQMMIQLAARGPFWPGLFARLAPALFYALLALFMFFFFNNPNDWAFWIAFGVATYAFAILIHWTLAYIRFRKLGIALLEKSPSLSR